MVRSVVHEHQWIQPTSQPTTIILIIIIQQQQQQPKIEKTKVDIVDDGGEFQIRSSQISYVYCHCCCGGGIRYIL
ncbi:hypothetical protein DERP_010189 [Dermatophagoides pteronyssinus]|uniref:Uncharacterized protein n=1 Tax=Dermatophagoides pteronyssinus TaxID=6956 RepID=A0ABQ8J707_DERPT|nr:hypothetical protein DERP_010189 [Dermatophagoides pteronyssinus]